MRTRHAASLRRRYGRAAQVTPAAESARLAIGTLAHNRAFTTTELADYLRAPLKRTKHTVSSLVTLGLLERSPSDDGYRYFPTTEGWRWVEGA
jgi:DNA-binding IclR family transcriptional regulator